MEATSGSCEESFDAFFHAASANRRFRIAETSMIRPSPATRRNRPTDRSTANVVFHQSKSFPPI